MVVALSTLMSRTLHHLFVTHLQTINNQVKQKRESLNIQLVSRIALTEKTTHDERDAVVFERYPTDHFMGCGRLRCLRNLLSLIDSRGFERSDAQERFHESFIRTCSRVIYKEEWSVHEKAICELNGWNHIKNGILISTPRRFGKTFRC